MSPISNRTLVVTQEAAYWYVRWFDERAMPREDRLEFVRWLKLSPENVAAILRIADIDGRLARLRLLDTIDELQETNIIEGDFGGGGGLQYDYQPSANVSDTVPGKNRPWPIWGKIAAAATLAVSMLLGFVATEKASEGVVETRAAQWRRLTLEDGSVVHLDARTRLKIDFTAERRVVHAYHGWAVFDVVKDSRRPFVVSTDPVEVIAVGTRFGIAIDDGVTTTVEEGTVEVKPRNGRDGSSILLHKGQELHVKPAGTLTLSGAGIAEVDARRKLSWVTGRVQMTNTTIGEIVRQFNRRHEIQADLQDVGLANRPVDLALMHVDNVEDFIEVMESRGVTVIRDGSTLTLRAARLE